MDEGGRGEVLCRVCGDKASGKHYGVPSCDGCRGFFKRSIRRYARNLDYVCKENGRCVVDVSRRNQCQACRFTKCLRVNMKRDAVQHERAPRNVASFATTVRRVPSGLHPGIPHIYHTATGAPYHPLIYPAFFPFKPTIPTFAPGVGIDFKCQSSPPIQGLFLARAGNEPLPPPLSAKEDEVTSSEEAATVDSQNSGKEDAHGDPLASSPSSLATAMSDYASSGLTLLTTENVYESAAKLLFLAVKWARSIPSFLQLSYRDQAILLEESWSELFVLTAAQWNFPAEAAALVSADASIDRRSGLEEEARRLRELLARCATLRIDHSEYACLKAIVLFKGESRGLAEAVRVTALQEQTVAVLGEQGAGRVGRLLLLLPPARALCRRTLQELLFKPTVGDVSVERLLGDMVHATRPVWKHRHSSVLLGSQLELTTRRSIEEAKLAVISTYIQTLEIQTDTVNHFNVNKNKNATDFCRELGLQRTQRLGSGE
ncbi:nuclear receptor subfamily 2 group E member 1 isoform X1 [Neodiprion pinetum]|uniref:Nuclear receptor subfamily 2 group E member 1-like isoform X1 n=2 Tax=Neodiprion lecontei TaxID=441921 RepID=A0ABM3G337_NEOLC|nr:nuclear receptor subfamily 2 group E member 1-like isoform X1 [Neodiprion pinetum]XP_046476656.1 nuclear receptor subfamily 2 group E member 1-like isoform X1 [Neodiprion pinetum]XP_046476657.1 nuclear receptor subfamily 2 group E member 1-like isoform X1 [Neodiprion pinetum]XP_046594683.1 nuclear receptor subfamily 2 group E member 1-like isoform X1 [Neodiprion lecontei]XP_046594684.1 nuclear receptor subfamily 2 group E member 1-like isoform X1 [Neodiprion lecontei]XP_046594685.1 nuclear 